MKKILFCIAAFGLLSQAWGMDRQLDSTLLVTKAGLTVVDGTSPVEFKCGTEWSVAFTENGQTATLSTRDGHWTLTGLSAEVAEAAVSEGAPLVSAIAGSVGVEQGDVEDVTSRTLAIATALAQNIGQSTFDTALVTAVSTANDLLDDSSVHPADFNDEILSAITLLGPSGAVIDASDTTVEEVHRDATKTIGTILNALASSGVIALSQVPETEEATTDTETEVAGEDTIADDTPADDTSAADMAVDDTSTIDMAAVTAAAATAGVDLSQLPSGKDAAAIAAAVGGVEGDLSNLAGGDPALLAAAAAAIAGGK